MCRGSELGVHISVLRYKKKFSLFPDFNRVISLTPKTKMQKCCSNLYM